MKNQFINLFVILLFVIGFTGCSSDTDDFSYEETTNSSSELNQGLLPANDPFFEKYYAFNDSLGKAWNDSIQNSNETRASSFWSKLKIVVKSRC